MREDHRVGAKGYSLNKLNLGLEVTLDERLIVQVPFVTTEEEIPGRYRVRDGARRIEVVSADDVIGEVDHGHAP